MIRVEVVAAAPVRKGTGLTMHYDSDHMQTGGPQNMHFLWPKRRPEDPGIPGAKRLLKSLRGEVLIRGVRKDVRGDALNARTRALVVQGLVSSPTRSYVRTFGLDDRNTPRHETCTLSCCAYDFRATQQGSAVSRLVPKSAQITTAEAYNAAVCSVVIGQCSEFVSNCIALLP